MLVKPRFYGAVAYEAPVLHLRRLEGGTVRQLRAELRRRLGSLDTSDFQEAERVARNEHYDDPTPRSPTPSSPAQALSSPTSGEILMQRRGDTSFWA